MTENNAAQHEAAIQEGERIAAADEYFKARTWIMDTNDNRRIFEAGFDRAYALLSKLRAEGVQAGAPVADMPLMRSAFRITETQGDPDPKNRHYHMVFKFRSMEDLRAAEDEWSAALASAPVAVEAQPVAYQVRHPHSPEWWGCDQAAFDVVRTTRPKDARSLYAAPQASEAVPSDVEIIASFAEAGMSTDPSLNRLYDVRGQYAQIINGARALLAKYAETQADKDGGDCAKGAVVPSEPLRVFSAGMWTYDGTGQAFSHTDLDAAAFVTYRDALSPTQPTGGRDEA